MSVQQQVGWRNERMGIIGNAGWGGGLVVAAASMPALAMMILQRWAQTAVFVLLFLVVAAVVLVHVKERPLWRWVQQSVLMLAGRAAGVSRFEAKATGEAVSAKEAEQFDLPGVLQSLQLHDGPPMPSGNMRRPVLLQHKGAKTWAMVASVQHQGVSMSDSNAIQRFSAALGQMVQGVVKSQSGMVRVSLYVRSAPADGAERAAWVAEHTTTASVPESLAESIDELERRVLAHSVISEYYVVATFAEDKLARPAKAAGGGLAGRAAAMYRAVRSLEANLGDAGCHDIRWLSVHELAAAVRTGFNPGAAMGIAVAKARNSRGDTWHDGVSPVAAGPSRAPAPSVRSYAHDSYVSASYSLVLPEMSTQVGKLLRLVRPNQSGERRCLALHFEPYDTKKGQTVIERDTSKAQIGKEIKRQRGFRISPFAEKKVAAAREQELRLVDGHNLVRVAGAVAVTVSADQEIETATTLLESSTRASGYDVMRLELAQDVGFVAAVLPVGLGMPKRGE